MRTFQEAKDIAFELLSSSFGPGIQFIEDATREFDEGWIFYYQSSEFLRSKDFNSMLVGNTPLLVPKLNQPPVFVPYHRPLEESMDAYRACGRPNAQQVPQVMLLRHSDNASMNSGLTALRKIAGIGLSDAKRVLDECCSSGTPIVHTPDVESARSLADELSKAGFLSSVQYGG